MMLRPDARRFKEEEDMTGSCRKCGCRLVFLPDDKRRGFCFECFDPYEIREFPFES